MRRGPRSLASTAVVACVILPFSGAMHPTAARALAGTGTSPGFGPRHALPAPLLAVDCGSMSAENSQGITSCLYDKVAGTSGASIFFRFASIGARRDCLPKHRIERCGCKMP